MFKELNMLPFSSNVNVQQSRQWEQMANMSFLIGLRPNFETAKTKVLLESEISSLQEVFSRVLCMENTPSIQSSSASAMDYGSSWSWIFLWTRQHGGDAIRKDLITVIIVVILIMSLNSMGIS